MKKSNKPLTFTAALLAASIGVANISGCHKTNSDSEVKPSEIESTTEAFEPDENNNSIIYGPPPNSKNIKLPPLDVEEDTSE